MKRLITLIMVLIALSVFVAPVAANNGNGRGNSGDTGVTNKKECEEAGGYWSNNRGVKSCNKVQDVPFERPLGEDEVDPVVRDFWTGVDSEINVFVVFVATTQSQRGNVGAPGTSDTLATVITCTMLGLDGVLPQDVCDWIAQGYDPDPFS